MNGAAAAEGKEEDDVRDLGLVERGFEAERAEVEVDLGLAGARERGFDLDFDGAEDGAGAGGSTFMLSVSFAGGNGSSLGTGAFRLVRGFFTALTLRSSSSDDEANESSSAPTTSALARFRTDPTRSGAGSWHRICAHDVSLSSCGVASARNRARRWSVVCIPS